MRIQLELYSGSLSLLLCLSHVLSRCLSVSLSDTFCISQFVVLLRVRPRLGGARVCSALSRAREWVREGQRESRSLRYICHALSDTFATVCGVSQQTSFVACGASFALRYFLPVEPSTLTCLDVFMDKRFDELLKVQEIQQQKQQHYQNKPRKSICKSKPKPKLKYKLNR